MENHNEKSLKYAWYVVFILMLANISSFIDRQVLSLLVGPIKRDMHLSDTQMSLLMGLSFALFYTLFGIFIGHFADKYNRRNIVIAGVTVWSVMTAMCGGIKSYGQFFVARMGVGVGEATLSPSSYSIISDYFPKNKLATALSTYSMGVFLGMGLAIVIGAGLISTLPTSGMVHVPVFGDIYPWQLLFFYIGLPGIVIALLMLTVKEPTRKDTLNTEGVLVKPTIGEALKLIWLQRKAYLPISIGTAFTAFTNYGSSAWIPTYFVRTFGWTMQKTGLSYGLIVTIFSALGVLTGGWLADRYSKKGDVLGKVRVGLFSGIGILASCCNFLLSDPNMILFSLAIPAFFIALPLGSSAASVQEIMPNRVRALASSIFLFFINIIGMGLGPLLVAFFTDSIFHDEKMIKYSLIALYVVGGFSTILCFGLGVRNYKGALDLKEDPSVFLSKR
jgi:MFS family permease